MGAFRLCLIDVMENRIISKAKQRLRIPYHHPLVYAARGIASWALRLKSRRLWVPKKEYNKYLEICI